MSLILGNTVISGITTPLNGSIAIGQIISSIIPLTDAGLHLLDGSVIQGGGIYNNFVQYIANLFNLYPQCFTDETTWQNTVNSKGVCGKFVYNSTNNTVRLPKITGFIEGTVDSNALGDLVEAGLPNIEAVFVNHWRDYANQKSITPVSGAIEVDSNTYPKSSFPAIGSESGGSYYYDQTLKINASLSNSIYGNSNTVQPQSIKVFYYIVVATTTKTDIEVDIDEIVTDLNSKANDIDVVHKTGDEAIGGIKTFTNAIKAASSDDLGFVVTTLNRARAQNGYYQLSNGLIINWGWISNLTAGTVVTFSKAFTSATSYGLCVTPHNGNNTSGYSMHVNTTTATSFKIAKNGTGNVYGFYIAVGY